MAVTSPLAYYVVFTVPLSVFVGHYFLTEFFSFFVFFGIVPLLDFIVGIDEVNPTAKEEEEIKNDVTYRIITFLWVPVHMFVVLWGAYAATYETDSVVSFLGLCLSVGMVGALGINCAHELGHKLDKIEQWCAKIVLSLVCYGHFYIEHQYGHHKNVSTPNDPASARFGESFYAFYPRTVIGSYTSAWELEVDRLTRSGRSALSIYNQMYWFIAMPLAILSGLHYLFGWKASIYFLIQAWIGFSLLEVVNYLEHYGLERREISPGVYENVNVTHSWNAPQKLTNWFLFKLQRHSDHHAHSLRRYQILRNFEASPELPTGYAGMALLALVPPLWRRVMDHRVLAYNKKLDTISLPKVAKVSPVQ